MMLNKIGEISRGQINGPYRADVLLARPLYLRMAECLVLPGYIALVFLGLVISKSAGPDNASSREMVPAIFLCVFAWPLMSVLIFHWIRKDLESEPADAAIYTPVVFRRRWLKAQSELMGMTE